MPSISIELTHTFLLKAHDLDGLLKGCYKFSTFKNRLLKQSDLFPDRYDPFKYRGDGFELFTEALIKLFPIDNRIIGIYDYKNSVQDAPGVDGFGLSAVNGRPSTVQCKFVSDESKLLAANDPKSNLMNFAFQSQNKFGVKVDDYNNMLIVTTAEGLHHYTDREMFLGKVRVLNGRAIRELVDDNVAFWDAFRTLCS
jgi:hypothetical protein